MLLAFKIDRIYVYQGRRVEVHIAQVRKVSLVGGRFRRVHGHHQLCEFLTCHVHGKCLGQGLAVDGKSFFHGPGELFLHAAHINHSRQTRSQYGLGLSRLQICREMLADLCRVRQPVGRRIGAVTGNYIGNQLVHLFIGHGYFREISQSLLRPCAYDGLSLRGLEIFCQIFVEPVRVGVAVFRRILLITGHYVRYKLTQLILRNGQPSVCLYDLHYVACDDAAGLIGLKIADHSLAQSRVVGLRMGLRILLVSRQQGGHYLAHIF